MKLAWREAVRFRTDWPEDWAVWGLRAVLVAAALFAGFTPVVLQYTSQGPLIVTVVAAIGSSFLLAAFESRRPRTMRLVELSVLLAFSVHVAGHLFGFYHAIPWYDTVLHAFSGFATGMCAWGLSSATRWFWDHDGETPFRAFYLVLSFVALATLAIEVVEFTSDSVLQTSEQRDPVQEPLKDTMVDLLAGLGAGAVAGAVVATLTWYGRRVGFREITEKPKSRHGRGRPS